MMNVFKSKIRKISRIAYESIAGFWEDDCYTKASTLTFYTIQSIVPFLAAILAIAKGFGFDNYLETLLTSTFIEQKEIFTYAIQMALTMLKYISRGELVGIGVILLLYSNINLIGYIELALNEIWKVKLSRSLFQRIKDFSFALILFPVIFVASSSMTIFIESQIHHISHFEDFNQMIINEIKLLLPWLISCILFGTLYFFIPNVRVRVVPRLIASIIAGTAFQAWQWVFIKLQVHLFSYNVVYGAFALLPLFLIWLHFSWMITLLGAEIAAHIENYKGYQKNLADSGFVKVTPSELALLLLQQCTHSFYSGTAAYTVAQFSDRLGVSEDILVKILSILEKNELLINYLNKDGEECYHPLYDLSKIKILQVCKIVQGDFDPNIVVEQSEAIDAISKALTSLDANATESHYNISLGEIFKDKISPL